MKLKLLHFIPYYEFFPPMNGGALRCYFLNQELAKYFEVTLITLQQIETLSPKHGFNWNSNIRVINPITKVESRNKIQKLINGLKYRYRRRTLQGSADFFFLSVYPVVKKLLSKERFDLILLEHFSSMSLSPVIRRLNPNAIQILDQHNVDYLLFEQEHNMEFKENKIKRNYTFNLESSLAKYVDYFFCCSQNDREILMQINNHKIKGFVVPNGTDASGNPCIYGRNMNPKTLLFCGSLSYKPNIEGIFWFYNDVWPILKKKIYEVKLIIIGRGEKKIYEELRKDPQIELIGEVESVMPYYEISQLAIVPLLSGSGTRLKILEAMSYGIPVVSTSKGAEGIEYTPEENILIANSKEEFVKNINVLINNKEFSDRISQNARRLIELKYSWELIVQNMSIEMNSLLKN